ncbi:hypothetical protein ES705_07538 [subsurface metagenome]
MDVERRIAKRGKSVEEKYGVNVQVKGEDKKANKTMLKPPKVQKIEGVNANPVIDGVKFSEIKVFADERGFLMEILRSDNRGFNGENFGQIICSVAYPGVVKAWHLHEKQIDRLAVIKGMAKVVLYDAREKSPTQGVINEFFIGEKNPLIIYIPPGIFHGIKCIGTEPSFLIGCPTELYNPEAPDELRLNPHSDMILYDWGRKEE